MATVQEIEAFLGEFCTACRFGAKVQFRQTPKNIRGLVTLNMTQAQATEQVLALKVESYSSGPEADRDEDGKEIWVFGYVEDSIEVYIKLRLDQNKPFCRPVVRSFHPVEHPLSYPHKKGGGS